MNILHVNKTEDTPLVHFDPDTGKFEVKGNSVPENIHMFYNPIFEWLDQYLVNPGNKAEFIFQMKMISSASTKIFFELMNKIDTLYENSDCEVHITWFYSMYDDEIREIGIDFKDGLLAPFEVVLIDSDN